MSTKNEYGVIGAALLDPKTVPGILSALKREDFSDEFGRFCYDFLHEPTADSHKALFDLTGTLTEGNLSVQLRERYIHSWTPALGGQGDVLRSRLKVQYAIPDSKFKPYLAMEVFTWGDTWKKTRHYVATTYDLNEHFQIEGYYIYYTFAGMPAEHILGIGMNMEF